MKSWWIFACVQFASLVLGVGRVHADPILGTNVTGSMTFGTDTLNAFDPANPKIKVPAGFLNKAGLTVAISATQAEFGFKDSLNAISADFTDSQLIITATISTTSNSFTMTFTDDAFLGATLVKTKDTFISAGVAGTTSGTLADTEITIKWPGTKGSRLNFTTLTATYDFSFPPPAAPDPPPISDPPPSAAATVSEPVSTAIFGLVSVASVLAIRRSRNSQRGCRQSVQSFGRSEISQ